MILWALYARKRAAAGALVLLDVVVRADRRLGADDLSAPLHRHPDRRRCSGLLCLWLWPDAERCGRRARGSARAIRAAGGWRRATRAGALACAALAVALRRCGAVAAVAGAVAARSSRRLRGFGAGRIPEGRRRAHERSARALAARAVPRRRLDQLARLDAHASRRRSRSPTASALGRMPVGARAAGRRSPAIVDLARRVAAPRAAAARWRCVPDARPRRADAPTRCATRGAAIERVRARRAGARLLRARLFAQRVRGRGVAARDRPRRDRRRRGRAHPRGARARRARRRHAAALAPLAAWRHADMSAQATPSRTPRVSFAAARDALRSCRVDRSCCRRACSIVAAHRRLRSPGWSRARRRSPAGRRRSRIGVVAQWIWPSASRFDAALFARLADEAAAGALDLARFDARDERARPDAGEQGGPRRRRALSRRAAISCARSGLIARDAGRSFAGVAGATLHVRLGLTVTPMVDTLGAGAIVRLRPRAHRRARAMWRGCAPDAASARLLRQPREPRRLRR